MIMSKPRWYEHRLLGSTERSDPDVSKVTLVCVLDAVSKGRLDAIPHVATVHATTAHATIAYAAADMIKLYPAKLYSRSPELETALSFLDTSWDDLADAYWLHNWHIKKVISEP